MARFLVEGYASDPGAGGLHALRRAANRAAAELVDEGIPIGCLSVIYLPEDETCLSVCEAPSADAVREATARASLPADRVVRAEVAEARHESN